MIRSRRSVVGLIVACLALQGLPRVAGGAGPGGTPTVYEPVSVPVVARKVTDRVYYVQGMAGMVSAANQGFNSNAGFVITDEGVVVFDALGTPSLGAALLQAIRRITDRPVVRVIISHYHSDHFYGVQAFQEAGAEIWAHERVRDYLATDAPRLRLAERRQSLFPWVSDESRVIAPDRYVADGATFRLGGLTFRLILAGPAHTAEDLMMLVEEEGVLFAGDLIFAGRLPFVGDADSRAWLAALDDLARRAPRYVIVGHGPMSADAVADIELTRGYLRFLRREMGKAVEEMAGFDEAYAAVDWSRYERLPAFAEGNRRNAYNTYLLMEREALQGRR